MLSGKSPLSRLVFPVLLSIQCLLTLGTMLFCLETFVMACERKKEKVGQCGGV